MHVNAHMYLRIESILYYSFFHNHGSVENGYTIWKVTILLEIHPFLTEPWLWEKGWNPEICPQLILTYKSLFILDMGEALLLEGPIFDFHDYG